MMGTGSCTRVIPAGGSGRDRDEELDPMLREERKAEVLWHEGAGMSERHPCMPKKLQEVGEQRLASCLCKRVTGQTGQEPPLLALLSLTCATCVQLQGKHLGERFTCLQLLCYSCAGYLGLFTVVARSAFRDKGSHSPSVCVIPPKRSGSPSAPVCITAL